MPLSYEINDPPPSVSSDKKEIVSHLFPVNNFTRVAKTPLYIGRSMTDILNHVVVKCSILWRRSEQTNVLISELGTSYANVC